MQITSMCISCIIDRSDYEGHQTRCVNGTLGHGRVPALNMLEHMAGSP